MASEPGVFCLGPKILIAPYSPQTSIFGLKHIYLIGTFDNANKQVSPKKVGLQILGHLVSSTLKQGFSSQIRFDAIQHKKTGHLMLDDMLFNPTLPAKTI